MFEEFKNNTITKNDFVAGLGDKADKEEIANIVSFKILYILFFVNLIPMLTSDPTRRV